ncbi:phage FluMu protein Com [Paenibacillus sp. 4624]
MKMCRYAISGPYKEIYACFNCRKSYKQVSPYDLSKETAARLEHKCPQCAEVMVNMGHDFQAPKQTDIKQWTKVMTLYQHGVTYHNCGCGAGYRPTELREVPEFLEQQAAGRRSEGEKLLHRWMA